MCFFHTRQLHNKVIQSAHALLLTLTASASLWTANRCRLYKIWYSHSDEDSSRVFLGCDSGWCCGGIPTFRRNFLRLSSEWSDSILVLSVASLFFAQGASRLRNWEVVSARVSVCKFHFLPVSVHKKSFFDLLKNCVLLRFYFKHFSMCLVYLVLLEICGKIIYDFCTLISLLMTISVNSRCQF
jgi:hypothetical protein